MSSGGPPEEGGEPGGVGSSSEQEASSSGAGGAQPPDAQSDSPSGGGSGAGPGGSGPGDGGSDGGGGAGGGSAGGGSGSAMATFTIGSGYRWERFVWALGVLLVLLGILWVAAQVTSFTVPFLVAFAIAYLLDPVVDRLEQWGLGRVPGILVLLLVFLIVATLLVLLVVPQLVQEFSVLPAKIQTLLGRLGPWLEQRFDVELPHSVRQAAERLMVAAPQGSAQKWLGSAGSVAQAVYGGTASALGALVGAMLVPVFAFFLLRDFDHIVARLRELVPPRFREGVDARFREIDEAISAFVRGQLLVAAVLMVLYGIGLWIVGLPLALVVALLAGIGNLIPYLGTTIGLVLATAMAFLADDPSVAFFAQVYGVFVVVQFLEGWVITPQIIGESVGLNSLAVIAAVLVFGELLGFFGVLVAVPLAAVMKILLRVALERYRDSALYQAG